MKNIFIINPISGNSKSKEFIYNLKRYAEEEQREKDIMLIPTTGPGSAKAIAKFYSNIYTEDIIYSVGGDGTLNEIVNGINPNTKLAIIPAGSGNDFYRVYKNLEGTKKINLGVVNSHKFINIASVGIDAKIADTANKIKHSHLKMLSYPRGIIDEIIKHSSDNLTINGENKPTTILTVCNGGYYGNGFLINPNYNLNSDFFNVLHASKLNRREIIILLLKILKGTHLEDNKVTLNKLNNIIIESDKELLCNVDGEIFSGNKFEFNLIKDGITVTTDIPQYVKKAITSIK